MNQHTIISERCFILSDRTLESCCMRLFLISFVHYYYLQVVQKTAATFAPRASTASKNPAVPGTVLYTVFEVQGYASLLLGGALSFNLIFPSNEPDLWRLMGMWSIWMFSKYCCFTSDEKSSYIQSVSELIKVVLCCCF